MVYLDQILHTYFLTFRATGMQNGDNASPSIISARQGILVKMLITLDPHPYVDRILHTYTNFTLSRHWYEQRLIA